MYVHIKYLYYYPNTIFWGKRLKFGIGNEGRLWEGEMGYEVWWESDG